MKKSRILCLICLSFGLMLLMLGTIVNASETFWYRRDDTARPQSIGVNTDTVQLFEFENKIFRAMLVNGKIIIESLNDNKLWREIQCLESDGGVAFVSLAVSGRSELIAGTADPGFLYIYDFNNETGKWEFYNNSKYLWSEAKTIISGNFESDGILGFLTQSAEGNLFYFKQNEHSPNLVWKSPEPWKQITDALVVDIDRDNSREVLALCKDGEMLLLKVQNNKVISLCSNYSWGRVLGMSCGDWDGDGKDEAVIASSQKVVFLFKYNETSKTYNFVQQPYKYDFTIEKLLYSEIHKQWFMSDLSGAIRVYAYDSSKKALTERQAFRVGRIVSLTEAKDSNRIWYLGRDGFMGYLTEFSEENDEEPISSEKEN